MESSARKSSRIPAPVEPMAQVGLPVVASLGWDVLRQYVDEMLGSEGHKKTTDAITSVVHGILQARSLALSLVATFVAAAHQILPKAAAQRLDRLCANPRLGLDVVGFSWVRYALGARKEVLLTIDWTDFDADEQATVVIAIVTTHGRATPLWWRTVRQKDLVDGGRTDEEDQALLDLHAVMPPDVRVRILGDRGFSDQKLIALLREWGWGYVVRTRKNIYVTAAEGTRRKAGEWLRADGRAMRLVDAKITEDETPVGSFIAVQHKGMKEPWLLLCDEGVESTSEGIAMYGCRFTTEETFRDQQDPRFGLGLDQLRIGTPEKRDRLLLLAAMAHAFQVLLGAAGEACGLDKGLSKSGVKRRVYSLPRQGAMWIQLLPTLRPDRKT